jgi:hypothetical protein
MPKRIQRQRTKGWRMPDGAVYVGRPTKWGNPFVCYRDGHAGYDPHSVSPEVALQLFRHQLADIGSWCSVPVQKWPSGKVPARWTAIGDVIHELRGKDLACWCRLDQACHADVLLEIANGKGA